MIVNHIMCTWKILTDFSFTKQKIKHKKWFCRGCLQCFSSKNMLIKQKENFLSINGKQPVKPEKGIIEFKKYFKQIPVSFEIHADFECYLKGAECYEGSYTKNNKITFLLVLLLRLFVLMIDLLNQLLSIKMWKWSLRIY